MSSGLYAIPRAPSTRPSVSPTATWRQRWPTCSRGRRRARDRLPRRRWHGRAVSQRAVARDRDRRRPQGISARPCRHRPREVRSTGGPWRRARGERPHRARVLAGAAGPRRDVVLLTPPPPSGERARQGFGERASPWRRKPSTRAAPPRARTLAADLPAVSDILTRLVGSQADMDRRRALLRRRTSSSAPHPRLLARISSCALRGPRLAVIAEMKQRTPSMGVLSEDYRPLDLAREYTEGGAARHLVLTHMAGFGAAPSTSWRLGWPRTSILRKDFITDPYEIGEARARAPTPSCSSWRARRWRAGTPVGGGPEPGHGGAGGGA